MSGEFKEALESSLEQRKWLGTLGYLFEFVSSPRKDIMELAIDFFDGSKQPKDVAAAVLIDSPQRQVDFSIKLVDKCLEFMRLTLPLIEAQQAAARRNPPNANTIVECFHADMDAFEHVGSIVREHIEHHRPYVADLDMAKWDNALDSIYRDYEPVFRGSESSFDSMFSQMLIQKIHDVRFDIATVRAEISGLEISRLQEHVMNAVILKKAFDEGIVEKRAMKSEFDRNLTAANNTLPKVIAGALLREQFYARLYDAGDDFLATREFKALEYTNVSIYPMTKQIT